MQVTIDGIQVSTTAGTDGRWQTEFQPPAVGGPYELTVNAHETLTLYDVLVGDVWLCSGQSNMEYGLRAVDGGLEAIEAADRPTLRLYSVSTQTAYGTREEPNGEWKVCTPESAGARGGFSAVAYFFAERLQQEIDVPIGLIQAAVGGSPIESWMTPEALAGFVEFKPALAEIARLRVVGAPEYGNYITHWYDEHDQGARDGANWADPQLDETGWRTTSLQSGFEDLDIPTEPAVVWFRRQITLPDPLPAGTARLRLGVVEKMDTAWINGTWVGASSWVENPRVYRIPEGVLRPGANQLTLRVFKLKPDGGLQTPLSELTLELGDGTTLPLAGEWRAKLSVDARSPHPLPLGFENYPTMPTVLYHGMVGPLAPRALAGVLWYQGEANFTRAHQYRQLLPGLIADWRAQFKQPDLPFYIVSLPAFMGRRDEPGTDGWAELREAQALAGQTVPNTETIVAIDLGDANDIHPRNKRPVGERLALAALARQYGHDLPYSGPRYKSVERLPGALRLTFSGTAGELLLRQGDKGFAVAGNDQKFHWAEARIDGDSVIVSSPEVPQPVAARYAWQANPPTLLYDSAGLPAMPFRTDDWRLSTEPAAHKD